MRLGSKIKELRLRKNVTQEQLAKHLSVTAQCISKWENDITMPDIQILPELSVYFGVTIDELFSMTDDTHVDRIKNMLDQRKMLDEQEFLQAEQFLMEKYNSNIENGDYSMMLSWLYNSMADSYRCKAEKYAKIAIRTAPERKYNHTLLRMAQQGNQLDWNFSNRSKRIDYYKRFVKEYPNCDRGYVCLIEELMAGNRLTEAKNMALTMNQHCKGVRAAFYIGYVEYASGQKESAEQIWKETLLSVYSGDWLGYALLGDCMARHCEYEQAINYYNQSIELQKRPRYTDGQISIATIYEIMGKREEAINAWEAVLDILSSDYNIVEGDSVDEICEEIRRLENGESNCPFF